MPDSAISTNRLAGRRAIVTGAAGAMGHATALRLAQEGAAVALLDFREDVKVAAEEVAAIGADAVGIVCDVGDEQSVVDAVTSAADRFGGIDTAVAAAGILNGGATHEVAIEDWETVLRVNLTGVFLTIKHTVPHMIEAGRGSIVTVSSVGAWLATGRIAAYDASKAGVLGLTRFVADEYADRNIRANAILPGVVTSDLAGNSAQYTHPHDPSFRAKIIDRRLTRVQVVPQRRAADGSEIAAAVAFLVSDDASFVTGASIPVDGGFTAT